MVTIFIHFKCQFMFLINDTNRRNKSDRTHIAKPVVVLLISLSLSLNGLAQVIEKVTDTLANKETSVFSLPNKSKNYPVLFGTLPDVQLVQSISYLKGEYLEGTPSSSPLFGFTGRLAGLYTTQSSGEPNADNVSLSIRGRAPLVFIDGVPRSAISINPEQIESVTVLIDALSTAMLGMRAMNGAVLITTKKGPTSRNGFSLNIKAQTGVQSPTKMRKYLSAFDYATLYNEALANDGKTAIYTAADLEAYKTGSDPFGHPDVDWTKTLLKNNAAFSRYTLSAEGNNRSSNYFVSLDYLDQGGLLRESDLNKYSTNSTFNRYIFRSNIEVKMDDNLKVFLNLFGRIRTGNEPGEGSENILPDLNTTPNNAYPVFNPNGSLGGNINYQSNIYGENVYSGYNQTFNRDGFVDAGFVREMNDVIQGWWIKGLISYNTLLNQETNRSKQFEVFKMNISSSGDTIYQRFGTKTEQTNSSSVTNRTQQFYSELSTGISRTIGRQSIRAQVLAYSDQYTSNADLADKYKTLAGNLQYSWNDKYIFQAAAAYTGNNRFAPGQQYGFFPSAGIAWNIHKEKFLSASWLVSSLKLRASYGITGNAIPGYFEFIERYAGAAGYVFGTGAGSVNGVQESTLSYNRTWEKSLKLDLGFDFGFAKERGWLSFDYYKNKNNDLLQTKGTTTTLLGIVYPLENLGKNQYSGFELNLGWTGKTGRLHYTLSGNLTSVSSKVLYNDEPTMPYQTMIRTGHPVGQFYGYIADGFVTNAGQGPVVDGYKSIPGDLKYKDLNGDGAINLYDQTTIGKKTPLMFYGIHTNLRIKNFYLSFLVQGVTNRQITTGFQQQHLGISV